VKNLYWWYTPLGSTNGDQLLSANEKFQITIGDNTTGAGGGDLIDALTTTYAPLSANTQFTLEIVPPVGAVLPLQRTTPAYIDTIMDLR